MDQVQMVALRNAYQSVIRGGNDWLLLYYSDEITLQNLTFCARGAHGVEELRSSLRAHGIQHAVYREGFGSGPSGSELVVITYLPDPISGRQRARALANARYLAGLLEGCTVFMTLDKPLELTHRAVHQALLAQRTTTMHRSSSESAAFDSKQISADAVRRTSSVDPIAIEKRLHIPFPRSKFISKMLRRNKMLHVSSPVDTPPDTPPKDYLDTSQASQDLEPGISFQRLAYPVAWGDVDEEPSIAEATHSHASGEAQETSDHPHILHIPLRGKWAGAMSLDPEERARIKLQAQLDRQREEEEAIEEERRREAQIQRRKQEAMEQELEDDAQRKAALEEDLKRAAAERLRRGYIEKVEEEQLRRFLALKKRVEKERRMEEYRKMEQWRKEQEWLQEKTRRESAEIKLRSSEERRQRISQIQAQLRRHASRNHGWATIQTNESVVWKRRFFKLSDGKLCLYRDAVLSNNPIEEVNIRKEVQGVKEWDEGYEELKAIPNSFVVEFTERGKVWMMYADTEEDKYVILGCLYHVAGWRI